MSDPKGEEFMKTAIVIGCLQIGCLSGPAMAAPVPLDEIEQMFLTEFPAGDCQVAAVDRLTTDAGIELVVTLNQMTGPSLQLRVPETNDPRSGFSTFVDRGISLGVPYWRVLQKNDDPASAVGEWDWLVNDQSGETDYFKINTSSGMIRCR
jgi:hypothetical protein